MTRLATLLLTITLIINPSTFRITFPAHTDLAGIVITIEGNPKVNPYFSYNFIPIEDDAQEMLVVPRHDLLPKGSYVVAASTMRWVNDELVGVEYTSTIIHIP